MNGPVRARKRPLEVELWLYDGSNADEIAAWLGREHAWVTLDGHLIVRTSEGNHEVFPGDRAVIGLVGERYMIKPDAYEAGYDELGPA